MLEKEWNRRRNGEGRFLRGSLWFFVTSELNVFVLPWILRNALEDSRGAHAPPDAHRNHAIARIAALEFAQDRRSELRAGAAERVSEGDGPAVGIDPRGIDAQRFDQDRKSTRLNSSHT